LFVAAPFAALLVAGCGSSAPEPKTFAEINSQVFHVACTFSSCHSADGARSADMLDLQTDPYNAIVNVPANNKMAKSEGKLRVAPGDSANSFVMIKFGLPPDTVAGQKVCKAESVDGGVNQISDYGSCMPQTSSPLEAVTVAAIKKWIDSGAPND
jgi:hypothetical protein